jgi:hypothetical protein
VGKVVFGLELGALKTAAAPLTRPDPWRQRVHLGWAARTVGGIRYAHSMSAVALLTFSDDLWAGAAQNFKRAAITGGEQLSGWY